MPAEQSAERDAVEQDEHDENARHNSSLRRGRRRRRRALPPDVVQFHHRGAEDAPVTVYLYEDLQCPACARFSRETLPDLVTRYVEPGTAKVVAEPIAILGPDSVPAAEAADAAGEQDRFWEYSVLFYLNQGAENSGYVDDEFLTGIAEKTQGLDVDRWNEARESGSAESELDAVLARAQEEGVEATPTLVVSGPNDTMNVRGAASIDEVAAAMDEVQVP